MQALVGTSGYSYKEWKGRFYPKDLPADRMLQFYGERFTTVEINNTFYRMPSPKVLEQWRDKVPHGFTFSIKASRRITHMGRLKNVADPLRYLLETIGILGDKLGPVLFQLPPTFKQDIDRLNEFLELLPEACLAAMEFRNKSWFDEPVYEALRSRNVALCLADGELDEKIPFVATADWGYLRLRGVAYSDELLQGWVERVREQAWQRAFVFFKHEDEATGPRLAARFGELFSS